MHELLPIIIFTGIFTGYFLSLIAPEELRDGRYYFEAFANVTLSLFVLIVFLSITGNLYVSPGVAIIFFLLLYWVKYVGLLYILSGAGIFFLGKPEYLLFASIFLFLTGMALSSIIAVDYEENEMIKGKMQLLFHILKNYGWFLLAGLLPFLLSYL